MIRPYKHPKTGMYWLRSRVPADLLERIRGEKVLIAIEGRHHQFTAGAELKLSLRTKTPSEAKSRAIDVEAQLERIWEGYRKGPEPLSFKNVQALAGEVYRDTVARSENDPGPAELWDFVAMLAEITRDEPELAMEITRSIIEALGLEVPQGDELMSWDLREALTRNGVMSFEPGDKARVLEAALKAQGEAARRLGQNARGDYSPDPMAARFPAFERKAVRRDKAVPETALTFTSLFENWAQRRQRASSRTVARYRGVFASLERFVGHDDAHRLTDVDIVRWHSALVDSGTVSHDTFVKTYRAAINTVYAYGMSVIGGKKVIHNPAARLLLEGTKKTVNRDRYFTMPEARSILAASRRAFDADGRKLAAHNRRAMRWVPWIGAYTGARPGEICQLRREDFVELEGIKCIALLPDAGTIKTGHFRNVPLHPHLLEQGIWEFAMGQPEGPLFYDRALASERPWENTTGFLSEWVRKGVGVTAREVAPGHGWRHWFKAKGHTAGIAEDYLDAICGHAPRVCRKEVRRVRTLRTAARDQEVPTSRNPGTKRSDLPVGLSFKASDPHVTKEYVVEFRLKAEE